MLSTTKAAASNELFTSNQWCGWALHLPGYSLVPILTVLYHDPSVQGTRQAPSACVQKGLYIWNPMFSIEISPKKELYFYKIHYFLELQLKKRKVTHHLHICIPNTFYARREQSVRRGGSDSRREETQGVLFIDSLCLDAVWIIAPVVGYASLAPIN